MPVFLGISLACSLGTQYASAFFWNRILHIRRLRRPPSKSGFAMLLYFLGICVIPAIFEELFVRGAVQKLLSH